LNFELENITEQWWRYAILPMLELGCVSTLVFGLGFLLKEGHSTLRIPSLSLHSEKGAIPITNSANYRHCTSRCIRSLCLDCGTSPSIRRNERKPIEPTRQSSSKQTIYSSRTIASIVSKLQLEPGLILIYDPDGNLFRVFMAAPKLDPDMMKTATCNPRGGIMIPFLVKLLLEQRPQRFHPSQGPWQLFSRPMISPTLVATCRI
jgi:hypothetical protein